MGLCSKYSVDKCGSAVSAVTSSKNGIWLYPNCRYHHNNNVNKDVNDNNRTQCALATPPPV